MDVPLYILYTFLLISLSAFISSSKKAFFVLDRSDVVEHKSDGALSAVNFLTSRPQQTLLTLLILHQVIWVLLILLTLWTFDGLWPRVISFCLLVVFYLSFGRVLPRVLVQEKEIVYIQSISKLLKTFIVLVAPIRIVLQNVSSLILKESVDLVDPVIQDKDFKNLVPEPEGETEVYEREMIQNVIEFRETMVKEVLTPRPDMFCVEVNEDLESVVHKVRAQAFSRIPVYEGDRDTIVGILYAKDLLPLLSQGVSRKEELPQNLLQPALHVPETKRVSELLREFKKQNVHIAMVVDEYGGVEGLACLEDLLEEIVGEIQDEEDVEEKLVDQINDQTYRISAMLSFEEFNDLFQVSIESEDYETIGGFVVDQLGHFPKWGEKVLYRGLEISVYRAKGVRILELLVSKADPVSEESDTLGGSD